MFNKLPHAFKFIDLLLELENFKKVTIWSKIHLFYRLKIAHKIKFFLSLHIFWALEIKF